MARRKPQTTENRAAAILTRRMGGVALSEDDFDDDLDDPIQDEKGVNMEKLLADLLAACGIHVPGNLNEAEFKRALCEACMTEVRKLTSKGGSGGAKVKGNPLIPGQEGATKVPAMYMSLTDRLKAENERLWSERHEVALALAMAPQPSLSAEAEEALVRDFARRMGCEPEQGVSLSTSNETDEDVLAELLASKINGANGRY